MGGVEPVEQPLMSAATLPIVQQHQQHRRYAEPLVVVGEHLRPRQNPPVGKAIPKVSTKSHRKMQHGPCRQLHAAMPPQGIQQHTAQQKAPAAVRDGCPHGQRACNDKRHDR